MRPIYVSLVAFCLRCAGLVVKPYETYRDIVEHAKYPELGWIGVIVSLYFLVASIVKPSQWLLLIAGAVITFCLSVWLILTVGRMFGGRGQSKGVILGWGYSYIPTLLWFWLTSFSFVLVPPPRTQSMYGILFSTLYLIVSFMLLFWKITLGYLTLRFGLRLDLGKILLTSAVVLPAMGLYSIFMYKFGLFRIPFI